jgi:hypothetical protein
MSVKANTVRTSATIAWEQEVTNDGGSFAVSRQGPDSLQLSLTPNTTTYNNILLQKLTIAAAGSNTVDFYSFTDKLTQAVVATKLLGYQVKATASNTGAQLRIAPGAADPLAWPFGANTAMNIVLDVGTGGCVLHVMNGATTTLSNTSRNVAFSNPGNQTATVLLSAIVGT